MEERVLKSPPLITQVFRRKDRSQEPSATERTLPLLRSFPAYERPLADPLLFIEHKTHEHPTSGISSKEKAARWKLLAEAWLRFYYSKEEALRAYREAVAVYPEDTEALTACIKLSHETGQTRLALEYAQALLQRTQNLRERAHLLQVMSRLNLRLNQPEESLSCLTAALASCEDTASLYLTMCCLLSNLDVSTEIFNEHVLSAIRVWQAKDPHLALAIAAWAVERRPTHAGLIQSYAVCLENCGLHNASCALWLRPILDGSDSTAVKRSLLHGVEQSLKLKRTHVARLFLGFVPNDEELNLIDARIRTTHGQGAAELKQLHLDESDQHIERAITLVVSGQTQEAFQRASEALALNPEHAFAAEIVLYGMKAGQLPLSADLLARVRAVLGDTPRIFHLYVAYGEQTSDKALIDNTYRFWTKYFPFDDGALLAYCTFSLAQNELGHFKEHLWKLLQFSNRNRAIDELIEKAVARLIADANYEGATRFLLETNETLGTLTAHRASVTQDVAQKSGKNDLLVRAVEQSIVAQTGIGKTSTLLKLAAFYRGLHEHPAEARTLLRVLAVDPYDGPTLERLIEIYAMSGEYDRLDAVLGLRVECSTTTKERIGRTLDRVSALHHRQNDSARALTLLIDLSKETNDIEDLGLVARAFITIDRPYEATRMLRSKMAHEHAASDECLGLALDIAEHQCSDIALAATIAAEAYAREPDNTWRKRTFAGLLERIDTPELRDKLRSKAASLQPKTPPKLAGDALTPLFAMREDELIHALRRLSVPSSSVQKLDTALLEFPSLIAQAWRKAASSPDGDVALPDQASAEEIKFGRLFIEEAKRKHFLFFLESSDSEIQTILDGVVAAFGAADERESLTTETRAIASELWRSVDGTLKKVLRERVLGFDAVPTASLLCAVGYAHCLRHVLQEGGDIQPALSMSVERAWSLSLLNLSKKHSADFLKHVQQFLKNELKN